MLSQQPLMLIGGGGHCRSCIDVIESTHLFQIKGIVEADNASVDASLAYPLLGYDRDLIPLLNETPNCLITIGQLSNPKIRQSVYQHLCSLNANMLTVISAHAYVASTASIGKGTIVMHQALVNAYAQIGENGIINSQALIEHDCVIGNDCHISTGAKVNGGVTIGRGCFIGSGAVIKQGLSLSDNVVVGANSTVLRDITQPGIYTGVIK
ncbi:acetyltransferase [Thiosulfatimonas sediminis]|uniref:Acetyltransferase n=1 Tax=Thiosulfatimonas sediminis TaxID=2675054 RepID=A0A6F8PTT3_9GAMM|nr:acetyltransferase [Thiosulfatimonas sediminis]BBP45519.1 acetyltransferase [Thiosulfatimonas sediminis]